MIRKFLLFLSWLAVPIISFSQDTIRVFPLEKRVVVTDPSQGVKSHKGWGVFPKSEQPVRKINMYVHFACPDSMRCADWDYADHIVLERVGGVNGELKNWEIGSLITPYGGFFSKDWQFTWQTDVTEFALILRDSCEINYIHSGYEPNHDRGWLVTIEFEIITGKPIAQPISITQIYHDIYEYGNDENPIEEHLIPVTVKTDPRADFGRLRTIQTGHGMDQPDNCAEFCKRYREIWFNHELVQKRDLWKKCGDNPLSPQAGTWLFDRANWCPGDLVMIERLDLPLKKGTDNTIQFKMEPYSATVINHGAQRISAYLIQYEKPTSRYDVAVEDIMVPSTKTLYSRINPASMHPQIIIRNVGSEPLQKVKIIYGTVGQKMQEFLWRGNLGFDQLDTVILPGIIEATALENQFEVRLEKLNDKKDQYVLDNRMRSSFSAAPTHASPLIFYFQTNQEPEHNSWRLLDVSGKTVYEKKSNELKAQKVYTDTLYLADGSYNLIFEDSQGDGLEFWFNRKGGKGEARLLSVDNQLIKVFESDCGSGWQYQFSIGQQPDAIDPATKEISIYPTRTSEFTTLSYFANTPGDIHVRLLSDPGEELLEEHFYPALKQGYFRYDLTRFPYGRFFLTVSQGDQELVRRRVRFEMSSPKE